MEGALFYWISWMFWIIFTFFIERRYKDRLKVASAILLLIILSPIHVRVLGFEIYASAIFMLLLSYFEISKEKKGAIIYFFICSFIITIATVTFHLFEIFDPIMIIFRKDWMLSICLAILAILLQKTMKGRILTVISGFMQGEILYAYILSRYPFSYPIGMLSSLDVCMLVSVIVISWSCLEKASSFSAVHFKFSGKPKPKSS